MMEYFSSYPSWVFCFVIFACKMVEITLSSLKTVFLVKGEKFIATAIAFVECLVWGFVISGAIASLGTNYLWLFAYCLGYALGYLVGSTVENKIAIGTMDVQFIIEVEDSPAVEKYIQEHNMGYFAREGHNRSGKVMSIDTVIPRKRAREIRKDVQNICKGSVFVMNYDVAYTHGGYGIRNIK